MSRRLVVAASVLAAFAAVVTWALWPPSEQPYFDMVASLRAAGEPVDFDGLVAKPIAPSENGAADLREAKQWLRESLGSDTEWTVVGAWNFSCREPWQETSTAEQIAELTAFLARAEPHFAKVEAALAKPTLRFDSGRRDAFGFPEDNGVTALQQTSKLLGAMARAAPDERRRLDAIACQAALANRLDAVTVLERMVAVALVGAAIGDVRREIAAGRLDPVAARARLDPLLRRQWLPSIPAALRAERVFLIRAYAAVLDGTLPWTRDPWYRRVLPKAWGGSDPDDDDFRPGMAAEMVDMCGRLDRASKVPVTPYPAYRPAVFAALAGPGAFATKQTMLWNVMVPVAARMESAQNLARVALAVAELHAKTGAWPASLDDVAPMFPDGVPRDAITGEAFAYVRSKTGVTIAAPPGDASAVTSTFADLLSWDLGR